ncbi:MAG: hypothetical protein KDE29_07655, partial [Anaerolineales bacterium]|nr:hypothetical protein [Anaerolineales bacterium]
CPGRVAPGETTRRRRRLFQLPVARVVPPQPQTIANWKSPKTLSSLVTPKEAVVGHDSLFFYGTTSL